MSKYLRQKTAMDYLARVNPKKFKLEKLKGRIVLYQKQFGGCLSPVILVDQQKEIITYAYPNNLMEY